MLEQLVLCSWFCVFLGFSFHVAGGLIHLRLVVAPIAVIVNLFGKRRGSGLKWSQVGLIP